MCLSVPARIIEIAGTRARVDVLGNETETDLRLIENPAVGDYVLIHAGFAIEKLEPDDARQRLALFREMVGDDSA
jgi:hydrogenase expression/formation protein HypC